MLATHSHPHPFLTHSLIFLSAIAFSFEQVAFFSIHSMDPESELPANWKLAKDADGREYYFNELTGEVSWKLPTVDGEPVAESGNGGGGGGGDIVPGVAVGGPAADDSEFAAPEEPPSVMAPGGFGGAPSSGRERSRTAAKLANAAEAMAETLGDGVLQRMCLILVCSIVVIIQSAIKDPVQQAFGMPFDSHHAYGVAVGCITLILVIFYLAFVKMKPQQFETFKVGKFDLPQLFSIFMMIWWGVAAAVLTFFEPFNTTSNAYFAIWAATVASFFNVGSAFDNLRDALISMSSQEGESERKLLAGLILAAFVALFAALNVLTATTTISTAMTGGGVTADQRGAATYALIVGILTDTFGSVLYNMIGKKRASPTLLKLFAAIFSTLWFIGVLTLTFVSQPFYITGNGFFATWACALLSFAFAYREFLGSDLPISSSIRRSFSFKPMTDGGAVEARQVDISSATPGMQAPQQGDIA